MSAVFDDRACTLGEGPLWHPLRGQIFWFDILGKRLLSRTDAGPQEWAFSELVSAAGWIDADRLLIASETALFRFDLVTGSRTDLCALEADNPVTRSNDGRADPMGGFWIGTMGKGAEPGTGTIYRYYRGELRKLFAPISISNSICFAADGRTAFFSDTVNPDVMRVALDQDGWPCADPEVFLTIAGPDMYPDGAVMDADGLIWLAQWGAGKVVAYGPDGVARRTISFGAPNTTCPAFGGAGLTTLFCTTAREGMSAEALEHCPDAGKIFAAPGIATGRPEAQVRL